MERGASGVGDPLSDEGRGAGSKIVAEIRHTLVLGGGTAAAAVLALLYQFVVGRALGPAEFADFATVLSLVYFGAIAAGPVNATAARFSAEFAAKGDLGSIRALASVLLRWVARYGLLVCALALLVARPLGAWLHFRSLAPLVVAVAILYVSLIVNLARGLLRGVLRFSTYNVNVVVEAGLRLIVGIPLVWVFVDAGSAVSAYVIALIVLLPVSALQVRSIWGGTEPSPIDPHRVKRFGFPMTLFTVCMAGFLTVDMVLVKHLFDSEQAGLYGGAVTLARSITLIYAPFGVMMMPLFVDEAVKGGRPFLTLARVGSYFVGVAGIPVLILGLWSRQVLTLTLGSAFAQAAPLLLPLAGSALLGGISALIGNALAGLDRFRFLGLYLAGLVLEVVVLAVWHGSIENVALLVLLVQGITTGAMILTALMTARPPVPMPADRAVGNRGSR